VSGCGSNAGESPAIEPSRSQGAAVATRDSPTDPVERGLPRVVFLGDSLTAGLHLSAEQSFPAVVSERLRADGRPIELINAGVSGDTSAGGLARIDWILKQHADVVVVGLGGNDGLRGLPVEETRKNLRAIVERARATGARVLLLGMKLPPNYGVDYVRDFEALYPAIARELDVALVPFMLEGVGGHAELNLPDGLHPNEEGQKRVAENVLPYLRALLARER
jgi:acyl-CoA thioesterase-1